MPSLLSLCVDRSSYIHPSAVVALARSSVILFFLIALSLVVQHSSFIRSLWSYLFGPLRMRLFVVPSTLACFSPNCACLGLMFSFVSVLAGVSLLVVWLPVHSFGSLTSWFCGTCPTCSVCPACQPQLNVSPHCECRNNLNHCQCNCVSYADLQMCHKRWSSDLLVGHQTAHVAQLSLLAAKRRLLHLIIVLLILLIIIVVVFSQFLLFGASCHRWFLLRKQRARLQRRQYLMRKHNLIAGPSDVLTPASSLVAAGFGSSVAALPLPPAQSPSDSSYLGSSAAVVFPSARPPAASFTIS